MKPPFTDQIASAIERHLVGAISHTDLDAEIGRTPLADIDPGRSCGKASRLRTVLTSAIDHDVEAGRELVDKLFCRVRGADGFLAIDREGRDALSRAFRKENCELTEEGDFRPLMLDSLTGRELSAALQAYVGRAKAGQADAALVAGTGKDLLEAVAAHVCDEAQDGYPRLPFPKRLGNAFRRLGMAFEEHAGNRATAHAHGLEKAMYSLACSINSLRNIEGTGHGRPWPARIAGVEAKAATEFMGVIAEYMLVRYEETNNE